MDDDIVYTPQEQPDETPTIRELIDQVSHMGDRMNATASAINLLAEQASNPVHQRQEARVNAEAEQSVSVDTAERRPLDTPLKDMAVPEFEGLLNDVVDRLGRKLPVVTETPQSAPKTTTPNVASVTSVSAAPSQPSVSSSEAPTETIPPVQTTPTVSNATEATPSQTPKTAPQSETTSSQDKTPAPVSFAHQIRSHAATQTAPGVGAARGQAMLNQHLSRIGDSLDKTRSFLEAKGMDTSLLDGLSGILSSTSLLDVLGGTAAAIGGIGETVRMGRDLNNTARNLDESPMQATVQNAENMATDITHDLGFTAYSGKQLQSWRDLEVNDYGLRLGSQQARNVTQGRETLANMGLAQDAQAASLADQIALNGGNVAQSFRELSEDADQLGVGFKSLTDNVSSQVSAADQTIGSQDTNQIMQGSARILSGMRAAGLETGSGDLSKFLNTSAFSNAYVMMMSGLQGKARVNAEYALMGGKQEMATFVEDEGLWPRIAQEMGRYASQTETAMSGGTSNQWANAAYLSSTGLSSLVQSNAQTTQNWLHGEAEGRNMSVKVTLSQGLKGEVINSGVVEQGEYGDGSSWLQVKNPELRNR
ncbi:MAG: hypothetical protein IIT33_02100 [Prevotella sp.]|nr:hypothetical protein [Prevotella sp.]